MFKSSWRTVGIGIGICVLFDELVDPYRPIFTIKDTSFQRRVIRSTVHGIITGDLTYEPVLEPGTRLLEPGYPDSILTRICAAEMAVRYAALSACGKVHVCHCNSLDGATWRSVMITGRTDRQTDRQTECDAICGPLLGRREREKFICMKKNCRQPKGQMPINAGAYFKSDNQ